MERGKYNMKAEMTVKRSYPMRKHLKITDPQFGVLLILPAFLLICFAIITPLILTVGKSFLNYSIVNPSASEWNGLRHYISLLKNPDFWNSWKVSVYFIFGVVILQFLIGFSVALTLNNIPMKNLFRGIFLVPWVVPKIVAAWLWRWLYAAEYGLLVYFFSVLKISTLSLDIWADPRYAMMAVIWATVWRGASFDMVMLLAGLQSVPAELYDAVAVDGGGIIQQFRHVMLPSMWNIIGVVLLITTVWSSLDFTMIWSTTQGGPINATDTLPIFIYREGFRFFRLDYGAAAGAIQLVFLLFVAILWIKFAFKE